MIIEPHQEVVNSANEVLEIALNEYFTYLFTTKSPKHKIIDYFDADILAEYLNKTTKSTNAPFQWNVSPEGNTNPVSPYIHSACIVRNGTIHINLDANSIEDNFILDDFIRYTLHNIKHEAVHVSQALRMGAKKFYESIGPMDLAVEQVRRNNEPKKNIIKHYLANPHEIMAHARDLSDEIMMSDNPIFVLRDPEGFIKFLPTWRKYRNAGFLRDDMVIHRLLKYTFLYLTNVL